MVKIIDKFDLNDNEEQKLKKFHDRIMEIMGKYNKRIMPLGKVLHEADIVKAEIKKTFKQYQKSKGERNGDNNNFDWIRFFDENFSHEFEVEPNHNWGNGEKPSDALIIKSQAKDNTLQRVATIADDSRQEITTENMATQTNTMTQEDVYQLLKNLLAELNEGLYEKERSIRLTLLAVLAGESTFMLGEPGTAKSLVARRISEAFDDNVKDGEIKFFDYLMNQFSTPEEIFGPVSIQELKNDSYVRKTECYLPKAQFAFLDEIWKANPAIQNALLTILNEKIFRNGMQVEKVPLIGFMSASNELPEKGKGLEAIFDRFLVRIFEKPISDNSNFRSMISAERKTAVNISKKLTNSIIDQILSESEAVEISDQCFDIIDSVRKILTKKNSEITEESEKYLVSDRRWKKIVNLMRVSAYCNNRIETDVMDATLIADCIWSTEKHESEVKQILSDAIKNFGVSCKADVNDVINKVKEFENDVTSNFYKEEKAAKKKTFGQIDYFEVEDDSGNIAYISCEKRGYHYYQLIKDASNPEPVDLNATYDEGTKSYSRHGYKYKVKFENKLVRIYLEKNTLAATIKSFNFNADAYNIEKEIQNTIKAIEDEMRAQEKLYNSNLFSDSDYYCKVIFDEQIKAKTQLEQLSKELGNQRMRYQ